MRKPKLYVNTFRKLKLKQIVGQIRRRLPNVRRTKQYALSNDIEQIHIAIPDLDMDLSFLSRFDIDALMDDHILLLNEVHDLTPEWHISDASHLWNFNLHYLEFLIPLAVKYSKTNEERYKTKCEVLISEWMNLDYIRDAWEPYTISLRIPNILVALEYLNIHDREIYRSIYNQYRYLQHNTETGLLANHYFENIKTIVIASIVFKERSKYRKYFDILLNEIAEQILPDGLHYERSLMYHSIILEDLLRLYTVLINSEHKEDAEKLIPTIDLMASAVDSLEHSFDRIPLFNDAGDNIGKNKLSLLKVCYELVEKKKRKSDFPEGGYYRIDNGDVAVIFDCGDIGPSYMGGHAHNDCLSFELSIGGTPVFVNSGTGQYQGSLRTFFRSTSAHNSFMIDEEEQSELWGEHRAGCRIHDIQAKRFCGGVIGKYRSYQNNIFLREMHWENNTLCIHDEINAKNSRKHIARHFFHIAPDFRYKRDDGVIRVVDEERVIAIIRISDTSDCLIHKEGMITTYAQEFGRYYKKEVLEVRTPFERHLDIDIEIEIIK